MQREDGWKNYRMSYERIEPLLVLFLMSYGAEAVILIETGFSTLRTQSFNPSSNNELLERSLDLIEERKESAMVQLAYY